ncbi:MAG: hypothetical protein U1E40_07590 [Amaricoccus sp.]
MDRNDLTIAFTAALVGAFLLGWIMRWLFERINGGARSSHVTDLVAQLHAAEADHRRSETLRDEFEAAAARRIVTLESELETARAALARAGSEASEGQA